MNTFEYQYNYCIHKCTMQRDVFESSLDGDFLMKHGGFCVYQQSLFTKCVQNRGALKFKVGKIITTLQYCSITIMGCVNKTTMAPKSAACTVYIMYTLRVNYPLGVISYFY